MSPRRVLRTCLWCVLFIAPLSYVPPAAQAGNGNMSPAMVLGNPANGTGVQVQVDSRWISGDGYRPMRVHIKATGGVAAPVDRQLTIRIMPSRSYRQSRLAVTKTIDLPAGTTQLSEWIYVPENPDCNQFEGLVCLGRFNERRAGRFNCNINNSRNVADSTPRVIVIDGDAPSMDELGNRNAGSYRGENDDTITNPSALIRCTPQMYLRNNNSQSWPKGKRWSDVVDEIPVCTVLSLSDIPSRWIGLTSADIICISFEDLEQLQSMPTQWQSLINWTSHGGNLFVTGCGNSQDKSSPDPEKRNKIASLLGLPVVAENAKPSTVGWKSANQKGYGKLVEELTQDANQYGRNNRKPTEKPIKPAPANPISYHNLQLGTVVLFPLDDPLSVEDKWYWNWVYKTLGKERWMWIERNGLSGTRDNPGFWQFMVPGVGLAPVKTFALLLTLFVVCIGPVSFVLLRKWKRPNWLMFTVPIAAAIVTLGLIAYALLTDGLSVRGRSRTITHINQRSGREATWSRQAYYAGLPPADGLRFDGDCAVYPIDFAPGSRHMRDRSLDVTTDQHFKRGYLGARETAQFMVQRCRATNSRLEIKSSESDSASQELSVVNRLGGEIKDLYIRDDKGRVFHAVAIKDDSEAELQLLPNGEIASRILKISGSECLLPPPGVDPSSINVRGGGIFGNSYYSRWNNYQADKDPADCGAERAVSDFYILASNTYLAVLREPIDIPAGTPKVRWDQTMHLVVGEW